ncbi:MAG: GNAT family N-acetyltransferase [Gammaproteobacteria bacterium]|nr:GNAT family N-acetyltransferase [Gammaproteobacteria bacterium]
MYLFEGDRSKLLAFCQENKLFFPIIGAVIEGTQEGSVYANSEANPSSFFVVHKFGFAQFIEFYPDDEFANRIIGELFLAKDNRKFRIYDVDERGKSRLRSLDLQSGINIQNGTRERFVYPTAEKKPNSRLASAVTEQNFEEVNDVFQLNLETRFWNNAKQALEYGIPVLVTDGELASICYGAAVSGAWIEIDVTTRESMRHKGYGNLAVCAFVNRALNNKLIPCWDCYSDNPASLELAKSVGFEHISTYSFYIVSPSRQVAQAG